MGTEAYAINSAGTMAGWYYDSGNVGHGFVRDAGGAITSFDAPGAGSSSGQGTFGFSIDTEGAVTGWLFGAYFYSFVRAPDGAITSFRTPKAGTKPGQGTVAQSISRTSSVTGDYTDELYVHHGFVVTP